MKQVVAPIVNTVKEVVVAKVHAVVNEVKKVVQDVVDTLTNLGGEASAIANFTLGPTKDSDSPWGRQTKILEAGSVSVDDDSTLSYAVKVWCVDCQVYSKTKVLGQIRFNVRKSWMSCNAALTSLVIYRNSS